MKNISSLFLLLLFSIPIHAQRENFRHFSLKDGLPGASVSVITQTNNGFIYFGTDNGISRFDGKETINYSTTDGLLDNDIDIIFPYKRSGLLIGTHSGLSVFDGNRFTNFTTKDGLIHNLVHTIFSIGDEFLIGTHRGISVFSKGEFFSDFHNETFDSLRINAFVFDANQTLFIGTNKGLFKVLNETVISVKKDIIVKSLLTSSDGILYCATNKGLYKIENNLFQYVKKFNTLNIYTIFEDESKRIWLGTSRGIINFLGNEVNSYGTNDTFLGNSCYSIFQDRELNLWFGSEQGVNLYDNGLFQLYNRRDGVKSTVWSIYQTKRGNLWIGTDGNGVLGLRDNGFVQVPVLKKLPKTIWNIFEDSNDNVWFATNKGAAKLHDETKLEFYNKNSGFTDDMVIEIYEDKKHNIWLSTLNSGIYKYDGKKFRNIILPNSEYFPTFNIIEDSEQSLWFASSGGLNKIENEKFVQFPFEKIFKQYNFYSIIYDSLNNNIVLGSHNRGLIIYDLDSSSIKSITKADGLNDNAILFLQVDKDKSNLWFGTNLGLNKLDYKHYIKTGQIRLKSYNRYDGFPGKECNQIKPIFDNKNQLWFSTLQGIVKYDAAKERDSLFVPQPFISSVEINYKKIDLSNYGEKRTIDSTIIDNIEFPYNMNNLTINFSSLLYSNPLNIRYRYMLHGIDENFSPFTKNDYVSYSSLSPGNYQFELISYSSEGAVPSKPIFFSFAIETPFWKSNYFISINILLVLLLFYIIYRIRTAAIRKKNIELLKLYKENISYQKQLIDSGRDYKGLFENAHNAILIIDPETLLIIDVNYSAEILYGYKRDELLNLSLKVLSVEVENTTQLIQMVIKDQGVKSYRTAHRKKDGSEIILNINASVTNYKGKIAIVSLHRDITEEEEITKQLLYAKETAERSDKLKSEFLALISHEIRTPINTILGYIGIISEEIDTITPEEVNSLIEPVKRSSSRIMRTIELILAMSEINAGTYDLEIKNNNVADLLSGIVAEQRDLNTNKKLRIKFINNSTNENLYVDDYTFGQIFSNLIDNAIKYTTEGDIEVILFNENSKTIIDIIDTGIGIREEFLPTLFDSFTQEEHGYSRKYDGNGLGLALVKNYVKINKGTISVESKKGIGSKFRVEFNTVLQIT